MAVAESFITSITASLTVDVLKAGTSWLTAKTVGNDQKRALRQTFDLGFQGMLRKLGSEGLSQADINVVSDIFGEYVQIPEVAGALLDVAVTGESPDLERLSNQFERYGGQDKLQGIRFDIDRSLVTLLDRVTAAVIADASQPKSALTNLVLVNRVIENQKSLHQLGQLIDEHPHNEQAEQAAPQEQPTYHSCFISYATTDLSFAERLHADLTKEGVNCWFAPQDLQIGDKLLSAIHKAIMGYDKLLVILSEHSIDSHWVEREVDLALDRERGRREYILFPIRLDDTVMSSDEYWAVMIRQRFIGDFTQLGKRGAYQKALSRLLRNLQREAVDG
ncbi:MAG: toll/interleukin-1 receptor domain-containing protein [Chloroflexota bacterium]